MVHCILCGPINGDITSLARHVSRVHGKEARRAYKEGKWTMSDQPTTLFSAIDSLAAEEAKDIAGQGNGASISKSVEAAPLVGSHEPPSEQPQPIIHPGESPNIAVPFYIEPKADLIWGATGSGKTRNIGLISDYVLSKYGKLTRVVSADGGGLGPAGGKGRSGQISFWALGAWKNPIAAMYKAVRGYWPLKLDDPESPLVPPDAGTWAIYGYGAFEGLTSWSDLILQELRAKKASLSQDPSYTFKQDDVDFSGGNQSYYGFMIDNLQAFVGVSHLLGYEKITWTAQESKGDDQTGAKVYGPMIAGRKGTGKAGGWFLNVWHTDILAGPTTTDKATGQQITEAKYVLFLKTHVDPTNYMPYPCKTRAEGLPAVIEDGNAATAYKLLDEYVEKQAKDSTAEMDKISGLRDRLLEAASKARIKEQAEAEKRAKASNLLKPMVSVPGPVSPKPIGPVPSSIPSPGVTGAKGPEVAKPAAAGTAHSTPIVTPIAPKAPLPSVPTTIQNVRKGK